MSKVVAVTVVIVVTLFCGIGCNSDSNPTSTKRENDQELVGNWECYKTEIAGMSTPLNEGNRMEISLNSDGTYEKDDLSITEQGTWRTMNDSLYLTPATTNVEIPYTGYQISGSDMLFLIGGQKQFYQEKGSTNDPEDPIDPNVPASSLYGTWSCFKITFDVDSLTPADGDWEPLEMTFTSSSLTMTYGIDVAAGTWSYTGGTLTMILEGESQSMVVVSLGNGKLVLRESESGMEMHFNAKGENNDPEDPIDPNVTVSSLYGTWSCFKITFDVDSLTPADEDWAPIEMTFTSSSLTMTNGIDVAAGTWSYTGGTLTMIFEGESQSMVVVSLGNGKLVLRESEFGVELHFNKK